jgi:hypothetical protein
VGPTASDERIDIVVRLGLAGAKEMFDNLSSDFMFDLRSVESALSADEEYRSTQIYHLPTMFKFDVFIPPEDPFIDEVLSRRVRLDLLPGIRGYVYSPEDIVIQKIRWFVLGNQVSDRQWNDIVQVLEIQANRLDTDHLQKWARHFGIEDLLAKAQVEAGVLEA